LDVDETISLMGSGISSVELLSFTIRKRVCLFIKSISMDHQVFVNRVLPMNSEVGNCVYYKIVNFVIYRAMLIFSVTPVRLTID
jgi:hypothetical protein